MRLALACLLAAPLAAQTHIAVQGGLERAMRGLMGTPAWIGYTVASAPGQHQTCDWKQGVRAPGPVHLEPPDQVNILYRVDAGKVERIRVLSPDCALDAGGMTFYWLDGITPEESVAFLLETGTAESVAAVAAHGVPEADAALEKLAAADQPARVRDQAIFWMGAARGSRGFQDLKRLLSSDPDPRIREKVVFALSISKEPGAVDELIQIARQDQTPQVRGQALFWLAHVAGRKAETAITDAIANDPETDVKKRAVFALAQLPDRGVPLLIEIARTNSNPAVRKQAMFWLGQSHDARAVDFFEQLLK